MTVRCLGPTGLAILFAFSQGGSLGQLPREAKEPTNGTAATREKQLVYKTVQSFLNSWLVRRDLEETMTAFGTTAFQNEAILQESCAGYIKLGQRPSEEARRNGIKRFLQDFMPTAAVSSLSEVLNQSSAVRMGVQLGASLVNDPKADGFVLAQLTRDQMPVSSSEITSYLRGKLPREVYASFVPAREGMVYFLWVREGRAWRILHASLVCM
jgi:hypothetical protein